MDSLAPYTFHACPNSSFEIPVYSDARHHMKIFPEGPGLQDGMVVAHHMSLVSSSGQADPGWKRCTLASKRNKCKQASQLCCLWVFSSQPQSSFFSGGDSEKGWCVGRQRMGMFGSVLKFLSLSPQKLQQYLCLVLHEFYLYGFFPPFPDLL